VSGGAAVSGWNRLDRHSPSQASATLGEKASESDGFCTGLRRRPIDRLHTGPPARRSPIEWPIDRLCAPAPARRLAMLRILVGAYATVWALVRLPEHLGHVDQTPDRWHPVGLLAPFGSPLAAAVVVALAVAAPMLGAAFVAGWRYRVVGPATALVMLAVATLDSAWGQVFHTENLMVLHLVILAAGTGATDCLALSVGRRAPAAGAREPAADAREPAADGRYGWPVRLAALVVVLTYTIAGLAKLRIGGLDWLDGDTLRNLVAHDNLRKALLGDLHSPFGTRLVAQRWAFPPLAVATLAVELGAGVALLGGRWRTTWVVAAWLFHVGVLALMAVLFAYPLSGVAFAPFFRLERLADRVRERVGGRLRPVALNRL
jgi:hypothetical protein